MRRRILSALGGLLTALLTGNGMSAEEPHPFQAIAIANIFRLRPPDSAPITPVALPHIRVAGITTITGKKQALLSLRFPATTSEPAHECSLILTEAQREGEIEALAIDPQTGKVTLSVSGVRLTLTLDNRWTSSSDGPQPRIHLVGMTTSSQPRVILKIEPRIYESLVEPQQGLILLEGEQEGPVEVLAVDVAAATVKIRAYGQEQVLSF